MDVQRVPSDPFSQYPAAQDKGDSSARATGYRKAEQASGSSPSADPSKQKSPDQDTVAREVDRLKEREKAVRAHEAAHMAAGGALAGGVHYTYKTGPDGKSYIVGGEVPINMSREKTPEATIDKMAQVMRAALAPADPSPQDRAIAAEAAATQQAARVEEQKETAAASQGGASAPTGGTPAPPGGQTAPVPEAAPAKKGAPTGHSASETSAATGAGRNKAGSPYGASGPSAQAAGSKVSVFA